MGDWRPIFVERIVIQPSKTPHIRTFSFEMGDEIRQIRLKCEHIGPFKPNDPVKIEEAFSDYTDHQAITAEQKETIRESFAKDYQRLTEWYPPLFLFDMEGSFRGRWDPSFSGWKTIEKYKANDGFIPGPIHPGDWTVWIQVLPGWERAITVSIELEGTSSTPVREPLTEQKKVEFIKPESGSHELGWVIGELHERSARSDGATPVDETLEAYHRAGYHFTVIADTDIPPIDNTKHHIPITSIQSQEIETAYGHALLLGTSERIPGFDREGPLGIEEISQFAHIQGGLLCVAHPFALDGLGYCASWRIDEMDWTKADLIEIWPGLWENRFPEVMKAFDLWDELLNKDIRIFGICGKDNREAMTGEHIEKAPKTIALCEGISEARLLPVLKQGHFYSSVEPGLSLRLDSEYGGAFMGDELRAPVGSPYVMHVDVTQMDRGGFLRIKSNQGIHCEMPVSSVRHTYQKFFERMKPGVSWFRMEVYRYGRPLDTLIGFTNPVFLRGMVSY